MSPWLRVSIASCGSLSTVLTGAGFTRRHGDTELGFCAVLCGSLSTELPGAGFHTGAQRHGAWVLCGAVRWMSLRVSASPCE